MACGAPVVCSDRTSLPEVVGDAALLVDPDDAAAVAAALRDALEPACAEELRARGFARAAQFTWERCAAATVAAYRFAAGRGR
jgi:glycosyltransferase involved in cell wall biosynthesis